ncbi:hypothetical protein PV325_013719 [Microctonus aethiopoides]|nr:hypothetical protein PV325_013719 [Microctonus aethiopoides]
MCQYLHSYWGRIPDILSVASFTSRTNNISEGFNRQLPKKLGGSRPIFVNFMVAMQKVIRKSEQLWGILTVGRLPDTSRSALTIQREKQIRQFQQGLQYGPHTLSDFLSQIFPAPRPVNGEMPIRSHRCSKKIKDRPRLGSYQC